MEPLRLELEKMLEEAIVRSPERARTHAEAGAQALDIYIRFLDECRHTAERQLSGARSVV